MKIVTASIQTSEDVEESMSPSRNQSYVEIPNIQNILQLNELKDYFGLQRQDTESGLQKNDTLHKPLK